MTLAHEPVAVRVPTSWSFTPRWASKVVGACSPGAVIERVGADPVDAGTTSRMRLHLTYRHGEGPSTLLRPALDPDNAWQTDLRTPAYGLTAWLETYASAGYQTDEVSLTLLQRFGTAFDDHGTGNLL